ncbi:MAG: hypothetical protein FWE12_03815 [Oscillospiraceae bacterium]|nr:hypothetical protein [Oscillospiraceae bacterium]
MENNSVLELVEMMYQMVTEAYGVPLGKDRCVIERDRFLDILDELKAQLPAEIEESRKLMAARQEFIAGAKREAESIRRVAEEHARQKVDDQEVVREARLRANELLSKAESKAAELKKMANVYADDTLKRTEDAIGTALEEVRGSRARFRSVAGAQLRDTIEEAPRRMPLTPDDDDLDDDM